MRKKIYVVALSFLLMFVNSIIPINQAKVKAEELTPVSRNEEEVTKTATYEEKKITLKLQKDAPDPKGRAKIDFEVLVDASGSMKQKDSIEQAKKVLKDFIDSRNPNYDRISITTFRGPGFYSISDPNNYPEKITTIHGMDNNFSEAKSAVDNMEFGGLTPLLDGLSKAKENLDNSGSDADRKVLIILGDGHPNFGPERDHYFYNYNDSKHPDDYYSARPEYYPSFNIQKQLDELEKAYDSGEIDFNTYYDKSDALSTKLSYYSGATLIPLTDPNATQAQKYYNGSIYDTSMAEYYDLRYLIMDKVNEIRNTGYEVFSVFLNNEKYEPDTSVIKKAKEAEQLFRDMAQNDQHYYAENGIDLPIAFDEVKKTIQTFDYFTKDTVEDGWELMPETFQASQDGVIPMVDGTNKNITWDVSGVPYKELEVSYHIKREIKVNNPPVAEGTLIVRHVDESGKEIAGEDTTTKSVGENYTTAKKDIPGYTFVKVEGSANGQYVEGTTTVTYVYKKVEAPAIKEGTLVVKYVDESGKEIVGVDTTTKSVGENYITAKKDIPGYEYVRVEGPANGQYVEGTTTVTYVYKKVEGSTAPAIKEGTLVVKYVDELGKEVAGKDTTTNFVGENYTTAKKDIPDYEYVRVEGPANGQYVEGTTTVTYVYKKVEAPAIKEGTLVVKYVDESGKEIAGEDTTTKSVGENYTTAKKDIPGYTFVKVEGSANGQYVEGTMTVTYVYKKKFTSPTDAKKGKLVVKYVDEAGKEIAASDTATKAVGENYTTAKKDIPGYEYVKVVGSVSGKYVEGTTTVTYVYKQKEGPAKHGNLIIKYLEKGTNKALAGEWRDTDVVGANYDTVAQDIKGYTLIGTPTNQNGKYVDGTVEVIYYYEKEKETPIQKPTDSQKPVTPSKVAANQEKTLPQTGESNPMNNYILGLFLIVSSLLILFGNRPKQFNKE